MSVFFGLEVSAQEKLADTPRSGGGSLFFGSRAAELTEEAEKAIERGLKFLVSNQNKDGSWSSQDPENEGGANCAIAGTSLALMAFLVEGHFPGFGPYGQALDRGKDYLLKRAKDSPTGAMGVKMYEIGLFTIAMSELWGMTSDPEDSKEIREALERVVEISFDHRIRSADSAMPRGPTPDRTLRSPRPSSFLSHRHAKPARSCRNHRKSHRLPPIKPSTSAGKRVPRQRLHHFLHRRGVYSAQLAGNRHRMGRGRSTPWKTIRKCFRARTTVTSTIPITMPCRRWFRQARGACQMVPESAMPIVQQPTDPAGKERLSAQDA